MPTVDAEKLLRVWETMWNHSPCEQAVALVAAAFPELSHNEVLSLPIGRRDALLLNLRRYLFGPRAEILMRCPQCGEQSEIHFAIDDLLTVPSPLGNFLFAKDERSYSFRLPNSADLLALQAARPENPRQFLVAACLESSSGPSAGIPPALIDAISEQMAEHDPQADISFAANCAFCGRKWEPRFDIVSFLWSEINTWAQRLIGEVHTLAVTYGWSEASIVSMSPTRRQIYLNMATS